MKTILFTMMLAGCSITPPKQPQLTLKTEVQEDECGLLTAQQCQEWNDDTTKVMLRNSNVQSQQFFKQ